MYRLLFLIGSIYYVSLLLQDVNKEELRKDLIAIWNKNKDDLKKVILLANELTNSFEEIKYDEMRMNLENKYNSGKKLYSRISKNIIKNDSSQKYDIEKKLLEIEKNYNNLKEEIKNLKKK